SMSRTGHAVELLSGACRCPPTSPEQALPEKNPMPVASGPVPALGWRPCDLTAGRERGSGMFGAVARKLFGSANDRRIRTYQTRVDAINELEEELAKLSDEALRARSDEFKKQIADGTDPDDRSEERRVGE